MKSPKPFGLDPGAWQQRFQWNFLQLRIASESFEFINRDERNSTDVNGNHRLIESTEHPIGSPMLRLANSASSSNGRTQRDRVTESPIKFIEARLIKNNSINQVVLSERFSLLKLMNYASWSMTHTAGRCSDCSVTVQSCESYANYESYNNSVIEWFAWPTLPLQASRLVTWVAIEVLLQLYWAKKRVVLN